MTPGQRRVCRGPAPGNEAAAALEHATSSLVAAAAATTPSLIEASGEEDGAGLAPASPEAVAAARAARKAKRKDRRAKAAHALAAAAETADSGERDVYVDMDVRPLLVETVEGRQQYKLEQELLWKRAAPLRRRLIESYDGFLEHAVALHSTERQALSSGSTVTAAHVLQYNCARVKL